MADIPMGFEGPISQERFESEKRPCPFCGSANVRMKKEDRANDDDWGPDFFRVHYVICEDCKARSRDMGTTGLALKVWNNRTMDTPPVTQPSNVHYSEDSFYQEPPPEPPRRRHYYRPSDWGSDGGMHIGEIGG
jgi:Lar family restriction alleviation protein